MAKRGRGRPKGTVRQGRIIEAVSEEYRKASRVDPKVQAILDDIGRQTGLKITMGPPRGLHKTIIGNIGDRFGVGIERMKQLAKSSAATMDKIVKRLAWWRNPDDEEPPY